MPNKSAATAEDELLRADVNRWRLLVRNPLFIADLRRFATDRAFRDRSTYWDAHRLALTKRDSTRIQRLTEQLMYKWGIWNVPSVEYLEFSEPGPTIRDLEKWYENYREDNPKAHTGIPIYMSNLRQGKIATELFVEFRIDTAAPIDHLIAILSKHLRAWHYDSFGGSQRGKPTQVDFQLKVYDLMHSKERSRPTTFKEVARLVGRPPATVREAYLAARFKIGLTAPPSRKQAANRPEKHPGPVSDCSNEKCRKAATVTDFCKAHREWADQDYASQRDLLQRNADRTYEVE